VITIGVGGLLLLMFPVVPFLAAILITSEKKERLLTWIFVISSLLAIAYSYAYVMIVEEGDSRIKNRYSSGLDRVFTEFYGSPYYPALYYCVIAALFFLFLRRRRLNRRL